MSCVSHRNVLLKFTTHNMSISQVLKQHPILEKVRWINVVVGVRLSVCWRDLEEDRTEAEYFLL